MNPSDQIVEQKVARDMTTGFRMWLNGYGPLDKDVISEAESVLFALPDTLPKSIAIKLLSECRRLQYELDDPNYQYSGRIHRHAILCRNAEIEKKDARIKELEKILAELEYEGDSQ